MRGGWGLVLEEGPAWEGEERSGGRRRRVGVGRPEPSVQKEQSEPDARAREGAATAAEATRPQGGRGTVRWG